MKEALKLALEALETCCAGDYSTGHVIDPSFDEDAVNEAITAIKEALDVPETNFGNMVQPEPPPECKTEEEKTAFAFGWWKALETQRMAQPDYRAVKTYHEGKPVYVSQPEQEPVAYFDWLPEGATHIARIKVKTMSGGRLEMGTRAFKYDNEVLMVYATDNDNEYPGWREAKQCFYHLNFPVFPIPTAPPKRPWVGLTDEEASWCQAPSTIQTWKRIEAKLKELNA